MKRNNEVKNMENWKEEWAKLSPRRRIVGFHSTTTEGYRKIKQSKVLLPPFYVSMDQEEGYGDGAHTIVADVTDVISVFEPDPEEASKNIMAKVPLCFKIENEQSTKESGLLLSVRLHPCPLKKQCGKKKR